MVVLSMFDFSGVWAEAFEAFGCTVVQVDLKHGEDIGRWSARVLLAELLQMFDSIDVVVAAPPCTAFACSYRNGLYDGTLLGAGWMVVEAQTKAEHGQARTEALYLNRIAAASRPREQLGLMDWGGA